MIHNSVFDTQGSGNCQLEKNIFNKSFYCDWGKPFPVNGQGTFIFNTEAAGASLFFSVEDRDGSDSMSLYIDDKRACFLQFTGERYNVLTTSECGTGIEKDFTSYWYSYDRDNLVLKYGKGYRMEETTLMVHDFLKDVKPEDQNKMREKMKPYFNATEKKYVREYRTMFRVGASGLEVTENLVDFEKIPFVANIPPLVLDSSKTNLFILDQSDYVFSASLPKACLELYQNIVNCRLNYPEELEPVLLSDAIRYSIETDGALLNKKLLHKAGEFGKADLKKTYLRITLGNSLGKSPGIPYVLEIWPKGHYSPIHNHGNANAVIKVLFGTIRTLVFNKGEDNPDAKPLKFVDMVEDDVTWIDRNWYQTHKLINVSEDYCATIQCYNYAPNDNTHWPYFDYVKDQETIGEFLPNSDFTFQEMRSIVLEEFKNSKKNDEGQQQQKKF